MEVVDKYLRNKKIFGILEFNANIIDPIKITLDSKIYGKDICDVVNEEVHRQIDKSNNNAIGYLHQDIFQYIDNCQVPKKGFDVVFDDGKRRVFVELKNKHNTMNSSSASKTYERFREKIKEDENCVCALVEVIAVRSQNIPWKMKIDGNTYLDERIRRISIDQFYELITNDKYAFYKLCQKIIELLGEIVIDRKKNFSIDNEVVNALKKIDLDPYKALFKLAFSKYMGWKE